VIAAQTGNLKEAERLWKQAFEREPGSSAIGLNLSKALYTEGKRAEARETVERVLEFDPDLPEAKQLLQELSRAQH
jgi:tetratricopeptide (TPR) repeat protein